MPFLNLPAPTHTTHSSTKATSNTIMSVVVFTGALTLQTRKEATAEAEKHGYMVSNTMTKAATFLVCGDNVGAKKIDAAKKANVQVLSEAEWSAKLNDTVAQAASTSTSTDTRKRKAQDVAAGSEDSDGGVVDFDDKTAAINGIHPTRVLPDGTFHDVQSASSSATYLVKRLGSTYTCNCPAWRNQRAAPTSRTCKHLKEMLGDAYEAVRTKSSSAAPRASTASSNTSLKKGSGSPKRAKSAAPKVLLANKWDREKHDPVNWWISEKLDGVRAFWDAKQRVFLSRLGNVYPAPDWFTTGFPDDVNLDGELFGGRGKFQSTVGIAKTDGSKHWDQLVYKVFDAPSLSDKKFEARMERAQDIVKETKSSYIEWVEHTQCTSLAHLDEVFDEIEKLGGEGLMIRQPASLYVEGRSSSLLKIKSFHDGEAVVITHEDGKGKYVGMTGALRCRMASGKEFKCASGLSDEQRAKPPRVGSVIVYKCQELTNDGIPRFPVFLGIAADKTCATDPAITNALGRD